jgi:AAA family ATP:ADP antiporter
MMLVSAALLFGALILGNLAERRMGQRAASAPRPSSEPASGHGGFWLVAKDPYLLLLGVLMLLLNFAGSTGDFLLSSLVKERALTVAGADVTTFIGEFYSDYYFWVNLVGVVIQLLLTSRLLRRYGVRTAILVLPVVALVTNLLTVLLPILFVVRWTRMAQSALDYSLNNTVRNTLILPLSAEEKYKAKQVVDTVFVRAGDVLAAGLVFLGREVLDLSVSLFALINVVVVVLWLVVAVRLGAAYRERSAQ